MDVNMVNHWTLLDQDSFRVKDLTDSFMNEDYFKRGNKKEDHGGLYLQFLYS